VKVDYFPQLGQLPRMSTSELRKLWSELFGCVPHPKLRRELLIPILAYRIQEQVFGDLKPSTARRLRAIAEGMTSGAKTASAQCLRPRTGTRFVRQWQSKLHEVITLESGFMYDGQKFRSLSEVARTITGARWSGPAFFGLKKRKAEEAA
jgi:hypothetical protein